MQHQLEAFSGKSLLVDVHVHKLLFYNFVSFYSQESFPLLILRRKVVNATTKDLGPNPSVAV